MPALLETLVESWNRDYPTISQKTATAPVAAMARFFHNLLAIHPFIDGNGRLARSFLSLQARDLFQLDEDLLLDRGTAYYKALKLADTGDGRGRHRERFLAIRHAYTDAAQAFHVEFIQ